MSTDAISGDLHRQEELADPRKLTQQAYFLLPDGHFEAITAWRNLMKSFSRPTGQLVRLRLLIRTSWRKETRAAGAKSGDE